MIHGELVVTGNIYKFNFVPVKNEYLGNRLSNIDVRNFRTEIQVIVYIDK